MSQRDDSGVSAIFPAICLFFLLLAFPATLLLAETIAPAPEGLAWRVVGSWRLNEKGSPLVAGDAIPAGSLLQADDGTTDHSITVFLADGRGILFECFTRENCARGFRVPSLYRVPDPAAVDMLARIHETLIRGNDSSSIQPDSDLPRGEVLTVIGPGNRVHVGGLAAALSNGRYTYDLRPLNSAYPTQSNVVVEKTAPAIPVTLPAPGLYDLKITDDLKTPRIDLLVAVVTPEQMEKFTRSYYQVQTMMAEWNEAGFGWPIHDFQRAYLESLVHDSQQSSSNSTSLAINSTASNAGTTRKIVNGLSAEGTHRNGMTAEPAFSPKPGVIDGDTAVILRSETPGASIHFTTDSSEPTADSPVYAAPIMVKGIGLTIRSFASAPGRKDSAVVTGIYRAKNP